MRTAALLIAVLLTTVPARAQFRVKEHVHLDHFNSKLGGRVLDFTHNHGADNRLHSNVLGRPRDLYVYLPPGYDPRYAYSLIFYFHTGSIDEHAILALKQLQSIDAQIQAGLMPPVILVCPDGTIEGENGPRSKHTLYIDGVEGAFQTHIMSEVVPFLFNSFSIRPEREAHAILGSSAGGLGAMNLAIKRRDFFASVATLAGPLNLRYSNVYGRYSRNFDPAEYRWNESYDPSASIGRFYFGLRSVPAGKYLSPVFGEQPGVEARVSAENPADLIFSTNLQPGQLNIYIGYPGRDNYNFDAQARSFAWLAQQRGIDVLLIGKPHATHSARYFCDQQPPAYQWLGRHLLPPAPRPTW
jgi:S-formylglutathione hydrolase FrmB